MEASVQFLRSCPFWQAFLGKKTGVSEGWCVRVNLAFTACVVYCRLKCCLLVFSYSGCLVSTEIYVIHVIKAALISLPNPDRTLVESK